MAAVAGRDTLISGNLLKIQLMGFRVSVLVQHSIELNCYTLV